MEEMIDEQVTEEEIKSGPEEPTAGENTEILESEDTLEAAEPAENVEAEKEDKAAENTEKQEEQPVKMKMPELEIPESMKNMNLDNPEEIEIPKSTGYLPARCRKMHLQMILNLIFEDTILAAASPRELKFRKNRFRQRNQLKRFRKLFRRTMKNICPKKIFRVQRMNL